MDCEKIQSEYNVCKDNRSNKSVVIKGARQRLHCVEMNTFFPIVNYSAAMTNDYFYCHRPKCDLFSGHGKYLLLVLSTQMWIIWARVANDYLYCYQPKYELLSGHDKSLLLAPSTQMWIIWARVAIMFTYTAIDPNMNYRAGIAKDYFYRHRPKCDLLSGQGKRSFQWYWLNMILYKWSVKFIDLRQTLMSIIFLFSWDVLCCTFIPCK